MSYAYKYRLLAFIAQVIAFMIAVRWLAPYGLLACLGFAGVLGYLTIIFGRWLLGERDSRTRQKTRTIKRSEGGNG